MEDAVRIGDVATFRDARPDKARALKPLEEAAEVFAAWQEYEDERLMYEEYRDVMGDAGLAYARELARVRSAISKARRRGRA